MMTVAASADQLPVRIQTHLWAATVRTGEKGECETMRRFDWKTCQRCGKKYLPTCSRQKFCTKCGPQERRNTHARCNREHHFFHIAEDKEYNGIYYVKHHSQLLVKQEEWRIEHPDASTIWAAKHPNERRIARLKSNVKRCALGFHPLNSWFPGCEGHHINPNDVIYIPVDLHKSVDHNIWTGRNMDKINALAGQYLTENLDVRMTAEAERREQ